MTEKERRKQNELADLLADWDGCEGGDLLRGLADEASSAQDGHGYALSDKTEGFIRQALQAEIDAQIEYIDDGLRDGYKSQEETDWVKAKLREIEEKYA